MIDVNATKCPSNVDDLTGKRFGRWVVVGFTHTAQKYSFWLCRCDCGNQKVVRRNALTAGKSTSCGCRQQETLAMRTKHDHCSRDVRTREYRCWECMISRATRLTGCNAANYRLRGITVCERWNTFENFLADMGPAPSQKHEIDRMDNNGNYEPGNCRWATRTEQARNTRRNKFVTICGVTKTLAEWVDDSGLKYNTVLYRLRRGWTEKDALGLTAAEAMRLG